MPTSKTINYRDKTGLIGTGKGLTDEDWAVYFSNFDRAWQIPLPDEGGNTREGCAHKGEGIQILQLDTGFTRHPELLRDSLYKLEDSKSFFRRFPLYLPPIARIAPNILALPPGEDDMFGIHCGHGTRTGSVVKCANGNPLAPSLRPMQGVAPRAELVPYRVTDSVILNERSGAALGQALVYAMKHLDISRFGVITMSLGFFPYRHVPEKIILSEILEAARIKGIVIFAAAGQILQEIKLPTGLIEPIFPARDPSVICCAGCDFEHSPMEGGLYGSRVDISAPAQNVWVASTSGIGGFFPKYEVTTSWGSSYATAITAGACALWQAYHGRKWLLNPNNYGPELIAPLFKHMLKLSAHKPSVTPAWNTLKRGPGALDAEKLLALELPSKEELEDLISVP